MQNDTHLGNLYKKRAKVLQNWGGGNSIIMDLHHYLLLATGPTFPEFPAAEQHLDPVVDAKQAQQDRAR